MVAVISVANLVNGMPILYECTYRVAYYFQLIQLIDADKYKVHTGLIIFFLPLLRTAILVTSPIVSGGSRICCVGPWGGYFCNVWLRTITGISNSVL